jgi:hypothetical protein
MAREMSGTPRAESKRTPPGNGVAGQFKQHGRFALPLNDLPTLASLYV